MPNMRMDKNPMPSQDPNVRNKNFEEVALGYTEEQAIDEAQRCLNCPKHPCMDGCPVQISIPEFIQKIVEKDFEGAYQVINRSSSLPAVCGRVCPQERQCESKCIRGIKGEPVAIGRLERFVADWHNKNVTEAPAKPEPNGHKCAVIGCGPSGLACASDLAKKGYEVTIYEALHTPGGVLAYGIPEFRLPKAIVQKEVDGLKALGVKIETNVVIGKSITIDELFDEFGYEAVFVGSGAGLPRFMNIPGENLIGVMSSNEYLTRINLMGAGRGQGFDTPVLKGKNVVVCGGGNTAMDSARTAKRMGAETVTLVYRRSVNELPARAEEVHHAMEEGIDFHVLHNPIEYIGDENGRVKEAILQVMELGEPDASGRRSPVPVEGQTETIPADLVNVAIGVSPNPIIPSTFKGLEISRRGTIVVGEETMQSAVSDVFAGGDIVRGGATVILAMGDGRRAAANMDEYLKGVNP